jgi:hypothetical protein
VDLPSFHTEDRKELMFLTFQMRNILLPSLTQEFLQRELSLSAHGTKEKKVRHLLHWDLPSCTSPCMAVPQSYFQALQ